MKLALEGKHFAANGVSPLFTGCESERGTLKDLPGRRTCGFNPQLGYHISLHVLRSTDRESGKKTSHHKGQGIVGEITPGAKSRVGALNTRFLRGDESIRMGLPTAVSKGSNLAIGDRLIYSPILQVTLGHEL